MNLKKVFLTFLVCVTLIQSMPLALAAPEATSALETIELVDYDFEALKSADSEVVDNTLYPSGMWLPTKYMDFLDFIPYKGQTITGDVATYLNEEFPEQDGLFTYAEFRAAERYLCYMRLLQEGNDSEVTAAIYDLMGERSWTSEKINLRIVDATRFSNAMRVYENFYMSIAEGESVDAHEQWTAMSAKMLGTFYLTAGNVVPLADIQAGANPILQNGEKYSEYLRTMIDYQSYLNLEAVSEALPDDTGDGIDVSSSNSSTVTEVPVEDSGKLYIYSDATVTKPDAYRDETKGAVIIGGEEVKGSGDGVLVGEDTRSRDPLTGLQLDSSALGNPTSKKIFSLRDFLTWCALIITIVAVIAAWIVHTIRKLRDPLEQWKM